MAAQVILVDATPRGAADGAATAIRLAGGGALAPFHYGGQHYRAGLTGLPKSTSSLDFDGEQLGGGGVSQALELGWGPASDAALGEVAGLFWRDAPITVRIGPEDAGGVAPPVSTAGLVLDAAVQDGVLKLALADGATDLKRALLTDRFAGTGGAEGPAEWEGLIKSRAWGRCFNVPGKCIDKATNVWSFGDPGRPWRAFDALRDRGAPADAAALTDLAWQGSVAATFTALQAAAAPAGGGVRAPSIACVKWWTEPGQLHADVRGETAGGYVETAAEIAGRIVAARSALAFVPGAIAAADAVRPAPFGWRVDNDSATAAGELSELLAGVSLSWLLIDGLVDFRAWIWGASTRAARSESVERRQVYAPVATRKLGYRRNWSPMTRGDLAGIVLATDVVMDDGDTVATGIAQAATTANWTGIAARPANLTTLSGGEGIRNDLVSVASNGALSGAGGGQVTITGLGYTGQLNATYGASWGVNVGGLPYNLSILVGGESINNAGISIGANGVLSGGGGGQVSLPGLGAGQLAYGNTVGGGNRLRNSSFETATADPNLAAGFGIYDNTGEVTGYSRPADRGGKVQRIAWNANTSTKGVYLLNIDGINNNGLWLPNTTMIVSWWAKAAGAALGQTMVTAWNNAPTAIDALSNPGLGAAWQRYAFRLTWGTVVDSNGFFSVAIGGANGASELFFDDMQIEVGDTPTAYAPRATEFLPGAVTSDVLATNAVRLGLNISDEGFNLLYSSGSYGVRNTALSISASGVLSGGGGGQVTLAGVGFSGDTDAQRNSRITVSGGVMTGIGSPNFYADNSYVGLSGVNLTTNGGATAGPAIGNSGISIGAGGALSGGGGGQVTLPGIGFSGDTDAQRNSRILISAGVLTGIGSAAAYVANAFVGISGVNLTTDGGNTIGPAIANAGVTMSASGALSGGGGGQVTIGGLGYGGDLDAQRNSRITIDSSGVLYGIGSAATYVANTAITIGGTILNGIGAGAGTPVANAGVSLSAGGVLAGAGGGQVTIGGLGYGGDLDAQRNSRIYMSAGTLQGIGAGAGSLIANAYVGITAGVYLTNDGGSSAISAVVNAGISISASGALSGGGGGQVSLPGLGAGQLAHLDQAGSTDIASSAVQQVTWETLQTTVAIAVGN